MSSFNLSPSNSVDLNYQNGLLPQRNHQGSYYQDTSCRSNLTFFQLSSENRRILRKTNDFTSQKVPLNQFNYTPLIQKTIKTWLTGFDWDFPISSVKQIFTNHIFNYLYIWKKDNAIIGYSICYFSQIISHIAYVFYDPRYSHSDLPIRLALQAVIDSHQQLLSYCYLGRFNPVDKTGYYKRTFPGFEYFQAGKWV